MSAFSEDELRYLAGQRRLGRLVVHPAMFAGFA